MLIFLIVSMVFERLLRKKLKIPKRKWTFYKGVNRFQRWIELALLIAFLLSIWVVDNLYLWLIGYFVISASFRAFMEWKFKKDEDKEYILTLYNLFIYVVILIVGFYILQVN
ncbi:DUF4181 domain-containing protein [Peribacillus muralis]|uniref:DUF4181 domain-containing protein n=2 Tax=Peribacillus muralis TaxID=264697 RepID=UPI0037F5AB08